MKKIIALLLAVVMILGLAACTAKPVETQAPEASATGALTVLENIWNMYGNAAALRWHVRHWWM